MIWGYFAPLKLHIKVIKCSLAYGFRAIWIRAIWRRTTNYCKPNIFKITDPQNSLRWGIEHRLPTDHDFTTRNNMGPKRHWCFLFDHELDRNEPMITLYKDLMCVRLEPEAQGDVMTFWCFFKGSKHPQITSWNADRTRIFVPYCTS